MKALQKAGVTQIKYVALIWHQTKSNSRGTRENNQTRTCSLDLILHQPNLLDCLLP